jgi:hypothetical protein
MKRKSECVVCIVCASVCVCECVCVCVSGVHIRWPGCCNSLTVGKAAQTTPCTLSSNTYAGSGMMPSGVSSLAVAMVAA